MLQDISNGEYVASGSFGDVYRGLFQGIPVVIKVIKEAVQDDAEAQRGLYHEFLVMRQAAHPHVLGCYALLGSGDPLVPHIGLVIQAGLYDLGRLTTPDGQARSIAEVAGLMAGPARAVQHLHAMGAVHGDIKPGNFIVGLDGNVLLSDLGSAQLVRNPTMPAVPGKWTPIFASPEAVGAHSPTFADDVWAFGLVMFMVAAKRDPFAAETMEELISMICGYQLPVLSAGWHPLFRGLLEACWHPDPAQRPTMAAIAACLESLQIPGLAMPQ